MTQDEIDNGIGKLVRRYNDNEKALAVLKDKMSPLPGLYTLLGQWLEQPDDLIAHKKTEAVVVERGTQTIEVDVKELFNLLDEYVKAMREKEKMENRLRQAKLEEIIQ